MVEGAAFYLLCHDDVRARPDALRLMVEEAYRSNAGVVGPKLVQWDDPRRLLQVGLAADKTGVRWRPSSRASSTRSSTTRSATCSSSRAPARSCGPTCSPRSAASTPGSTCWARTSTCAGGPRSPGPGCWWHPQAVARHLEALGTPPRPERAAPAAGPAPAADDAHLLRAVPPRAGASPGGAADPGRGGVLARRRADGPGPRRGGGVELERRPLARPADAAPGAARRPPGPRQRGPPPPGQGQRSLRRRTSGARSGASDDRLRSLATAGRDLAGAVREGRGRTDLVVWTVVAVLLMAGSRVLFFDGPPVIGDLPAFSAGPRDLFTQWFSGWRSVGLGQESPAPTAFGAAGSRRHRHVRPDGAAAHPVRRRTAAGRRRRRMAARAFVRVAAGSAGRRWSSTRRSPCRTTPSRPGDGAGSSPGRPCRGCSARLVRRHRRRAVRRPATRRAPGAARPRAVVRGGRRVRPGDRDRGGRRRRRPRRQWCAARAAAVERGARGHWRARASRPCSTCPGPSTSSRPGGSGPSFGGVPGQEVRSLAELLRFETGPFGAAPIGWVFLVPAAPAAARRARLALRLGRAGVDDRGRCLGPGMARRPGVVGPAVRAARGPAGRGGGRPGAGRRARAGRLRGRPARATGSGGARWHRCRPRWPWSSVLSPSSWPCRTDAGGRRARGSTACSAFSPRMPPPATFACCGSVTPMCCPAGAGRWAMAWRTR